MLDQFGRKINYLRLSVTDLCNLRCEYCMPEKGVHKMRHEDILSVEEIEEIVRAAADCGIEKVRITGGEPLVRKGIVEICGRVASIPGVQEVCLTTNALMLPELAAPLAGAGVKRINMSLDTLDPEKYRRITRGGDLSQALLGMEAARRAGMGQMKVNTVLIGGFNDEEVPELVEMTREEPIQLRFIELMPIGQCAAWDRERFQAADTVLEKVPALQRQGTEGVARVYRVPGYRGTVGLISPMSNHFCPACNRIRVTADGKLKACLHSAEEINLRGLHGETLHSAMRGAIQNKPRQHWMDGNHASKSQRGMFEIGG